MRPKGSKSNYKKNRTYLSWGNIKKLIADYSTMSNRELMDKYNISKSQLFNIRLQYKLKLKSFSLYMTDARRLDLNSGESLCGIYAIVRDDGLKVYIGSSVDVIGRIKGHVNSLVCHTHYNQTLQEDWDKYGFIMYLLEPCEEKDLLIRENEIIMLLDSYVCYNKNVVPGHDLDYKALFEFIKSKMVATESGCWEWPGKVNKDGYGVLKCGNKYLYTHRVAYLAHYDSEAMLVGHICNNKRCCNPEHLKSKSYRENIQHRFNTDCPLRRSTLYPYLEDIKQMLTQKLKVKEIHRRLNTDISYGALYQFCKKVRKVYTL